MATPKFTDCRTCYFENREPTICIGCVNASEYQSRELDSAGLEDLKEIHFYSNDGDD